MLTVIKVILMWFDEDSDKDCIGAVWGREW